MVLTIPSIFTGAYPTGFLAAGLVLVLAPPAVVLFGYGSGVLWRGTIAAAHSRAPSG